ncbi:ABC transporter substrate-binding protein [Botryobacter ruber]|uniref:ABC transporter substrate-binding protein n=1 Tax=Botryobacter ruber TaxID=2171629 RepID=UPI000E0C0F9C|nr:CDC27 family protein [Botryobacter ruber]
MKKRFLRHVAGFLFSAALTIAAAQAQQLQNYEVNYNNGKVLLNQQRYELAMAELLPVTVNAAGNAYAPEATYLYALAALKAQKPQEAVLMLQQLKAQHPQWYGMPDAHYLLANALFEQQKYDEALAELNLIRAASLSADAETLKRFYLIRLTDRKQYEKLLQRYPNDKLVGQLYADKLLAGWYKPEDKATLERIVAKFNLDRNQYLRADALRKEAYNVALLLPFQLNQDLAQTARKNQFITDLYAGMKLAQDSLSKQGININLLAYDTGADTTSAKQVLAMPEVKQMDLVIGPVYKSTARLASRFAAENNVTVINPLSQDLEVTGNSNNVLLFESSVATQAQQAATFAYQNFSPKTAIIIVENKKDDTTFAHHYRQQFIKLGGRVKTYRKINSGQAAATASVFKGLNLADVGHMAVFSEQMTAAVNATSLLSGEAAKLPLITYDKWLDIHQITLRQLDRLEVYFISPKYIDKMSPAAAQFRQKYLEKYNLPPSVYAYAGFEMLYYFGTILSAHGPAFTQSLATIGVKPGVFYPGIGYKNTGSPQAEVRKDNQYIPITKLENLQLVVVNPVSY